MEGAVATKRHFVFLMQGQVESIMNVSEMTVVTSGPTGKSENYFSFLFPKEIALLTCGLCLSSLQ